MTPPGIVTPPRRVVRLEGPVRERPERPLVERPDRPEVVAPPVRIVAPPGVPGVAPPSVPTLAFTGSDAIELTARGTSMVLLGGFAVLAMRRPAPHVIAARSPDVKAVPIRGRLHTSVG